MKKIFLILTTLVVSYSQAQDINDALRYAQSNSGGSARYRAMGGAFGALGGDLSSMKVNPAGSVIFANNQIGFTLSNSNELTDSHYFGTKSSDSKSSLNIGQLGAVFVFQNNYRNDSNWKKFAISANYENSRDFNSSVNIVGTNPYSSIDNYFLSNANGVAFETIDNISYQNLYYNEQQAYLGYNSYILDYDSINQEFYTNIAPGGNYNQTNRIKNYGYNGKLSFNFSGQYTDKFSFGINLNSHFADFSQIGRFTERNNNPKYPTFSTVDQVVFNNDLQTYGSGFSLQLGTIFKPIKQLRLGLAYESPTWYRLTDDVTQSIITSGYGLSNSRNPNEYFSNITTNPGLTVTFEPYKLQTPSKWTGSLAYVFGKRGLISVDYAIKDYSKTQFKPKNDFAYDNSYMKNVLTSTGELRLGAEYKIKKVSLRGGYRWEQSPYKDHINMGDLTTYSGGLGYNFGSIKLDMAYSHGKTYYNQQMFSQGLTDKAKINAVNHSITATLLFEL
jgi:hypothetical protein